MQTIFQSCTEFHDLKIHDENFKGWTKNASLMF